MSGSLWQYHKDDANNNITDSGSFKFRTRITERTPSAENTKEVIIASPLKYSIKF